MLKRFVAISGLPGSGKTTLARHLAPALRLPLIDKDDILDRLFDSRGAGNSAWRRTLSRESDLLFQAEAAASNGAVLVSFWHVPGMPADSGTPTAWLRDLSAPIVQVHCNCDPELAAQRFQSRRRHPGHLDREASFERSLADIRALARLDPPQIGPRVDVDTTRELSLAQVLVDIGAAFARRP